MIFFLIDVQILSAFSDAVLKLCQDCKRRLMERNDRLRHVDNLQLELSERLARLNLWLENAERKLDSILPSAVPEETEADLEIVRTLMEDETVLSRDLSTAARLWVEVTSLPDGSAVPNRHTDLTIQVCCEF